MAAVVASAKFKGHFPKVLKPCKDVSVPFFACIDTASADLKTYPASAGACAAEMKKYDDCMEKHLGGRTTSTYKAPDSYVKR